MRHTAQHTAQHTVGMMTAARAPRRRMLALVGVAAALAAGACGPSDTDTAADTAGPMAGDTAGAALAAPAQPGTQMQAVLTQLASLGGEPIPTLAPAAAREQPTPTDAVMAALRAESRDTAPTALVPGVTSVDRSIAGAAGQIPARIYTPDGAGPFPVIVYYHGGGWVIGSKEVYDGGARGIAKQANAIVISVDYRLAPAAKFPAQHDDALAAGQWAVANARSINGDSTRMALAGESAGGNLAVATAIAVRDQGLQAPLHVLSVYPIAQTDTTTPSYVTYADAKPLSRPMMSWFFEHTVRTPADLQDPRLNLVGATLRGLPSVTIINAEIDPLLDDSAMLERALRDAGVEVERRVYDGVTHEFFGMAAVVDEATQAQEFAGERLRAALGG